PSLIILAALLSLVITIVFYRKVSIDSGKKLALQQALVQKNEEIASRIITIQRIASQISSGDYDIRMDADSADSLGALSGSLNSMAESLQYSFALLANKEWLQTGLAGVNNTMVGEKTLSSLVKDSLASVAQHVGAQVGAVYVYQDDNRLHLEGHYAGDKKQLPKVLEVGEGFVGESFAANKTMLLTALPENELTISYATGRTKPVNVYVTPIYRNGTPIGVMELGSIHEFSDKQLEFVLATTEPIGLGIHVAQNRQKLQDLLEETQTQTEELQAQTEELQTQHGELEGMNAELEAQTQKIQASEEELRVQQEELIQANQELEERTSLLEERNEMISDRNREIQKKAEELELSTKYKSEFLANMSHELRTPLNSILLLSRLMADTEDLDKEYVEYASVIQSSGQGLLTLIDEILDLSKIEAGKMHIEIDQVNVPDVIKDLKAMFNPLAKEKKLDFSINQDKMGS
ncbi:MAG: histidine kinase, partial [Chitinophagaceae bacterium]